MICPRCQWTNCTCTIEDQPTGTVRRYGEMTTEQLQAFCARATKRPGLATPFTRAGYTWASNAIALVRVPVVEGVRVCDDPWPTPFPAGIMAEYQPGPQWYALPALPERVQDRPCSECGGRKREPCKACNDKGTVVYTFDHRGVVYDMDCDCPVCDGERECRHCHGDGIEPRVPQRVRIGQATFDADALRPFAALDHCELAPVDAYAPCRVRFDGGEGLVMPLNLPGGDK